MNREPESERDLAAELLARDAAVPASPAQPAIEALIEREAHFEARVRRTAKLAWTGTFATLPILGGSMFLIDQGAGSSVEIARMLMMVFGMAGMLALLIALLTTISWLFRGRAASLAAVEERLATLERILLAQARAR